MRIEELEYLPVSVLGLPFFIGCFVVSSHTPQLAYSVVIMRYLCVFHIANHLNIPY